MFSILIYKTKGIKMTKMQHMAMALLVLVLLSRCFKSEAKIRHHKLAPEIKKEKEACTKKSEIKHTKHIEVPKSESDNKIRLRHAPLK
jgi:hypothetical protein